MVLRTVILPTATYTAPSQYCPSTVLSNLTLSCPYQDQEADASLEISDFAEVLPKFESAEQDWNSFGYLLNEQPGTSSDKTTTPIKKITVFQKPVEPIGKGPRRRRRCADREISELAAKPKAEVKKEVINPADITLGGDTYDYVKEQKPTESIATNVSRRRRTSANLSKSEDDRDKPESQSTAPKSKERRTSEPPASHVAFHTPGSATPHDINLSIEHCTCQKIFDASKLYIQCELCARWYHGDCVGVAEQTILGLEHWSCEECIEEQERVKDQPALYCVCQKPYDDTKFYVGCDSCQGWFHPECVGTTRAEAEQAADYNCPACTREAEGYESEASDVSGSSRVSVQLTRADYTHVFELLELLLEHRMSTPFRNPVDLNEFPDYEKFIKKPMDLSTITKKVERTEYLYLSQFVNDVNQMFENAKTYNPKGNAVFKCAETMQEVFDKKLIDVREQMTARQQMLLLATAQQQDPMSSIRKRVQSESQRTVDSLDIDSDQLLPLDANLMRLYDI